MNRSGENTNRTSTTVLARRIKSEMSKHDALVRLLNVNLRHYSRSPEARAAAARNLLIYAFMLCAEESSAEDAIDAVTSAYTLEEAA